MALRTKTPPKPIYKKFTLRIEKGEWEQFRSLFCTRIFTNNKAAVYALNHYTSLTPKKLP